MNTLHNNSLSSRIAVLIDGDNISARKLDEIVRYAVSYGELTVCKVFGDWTRQALSGWKMSSAKYGFQLVQATAYTTGKNTSDLAIVMEAMDIMYQHLANTICIASSDGDFTGLAQRLRESGIRVLGFGSSQTPESLMSSCSSFLCTGYVDSKIPVNTPPLERHPVTQTEPKRKMQETQTCLSSQQYLQEGSPDTNLRTVISIGEEIAEADAEIKKAAKKKAATLQCASSMTKKVNDPIQRNKQAFFKAFMAAADGKKMADMAVVSKFIFKEFKSFRVKDYGCNKTIRIYEALGFSVKKGKKKTYIQMPVNYR